MGLLAKLLTPLSLLKLAALALLYVLTAIALGAGATFYLVRTAGDDAQRGQTVLLAELVSARTREAMLPYQEPLRRLAHAPETATLLAPDKTLQRLKKAGDLKAGRPEVLQATIVPAREFSETELAQHLTAPNARDRQGGFGRLRYHATEPDGLHIDLIEPIPAAADGAPIGATLLRIDGRVLQKIVEHSLPADGQLTLRLAGAGGMVLAQAGTAPADDWLVTVAPVPQAPWELQLAQKPRWPEFANGQRSIYLLLVVAAVLVAIVGVSHVHYLTMRAMDNDIRSIARIFQDMREGNIRVDYPIEFADFRKIFTYLRHSGMKLVKQQQRLRSMGLIDHLSQQHNRRAFEKRLDALFERARSTGPSSVLIIDLDHFKQVNDNYGHDVGDNLIVGFSEAVKRLVRNTDFLARLGGDEFCIIFPHIDLERAISRVAALRHELPEQIVLTPSYQHPLRWTGGLAVIQDGDAHPDEVLKRADQALLKAKEAGRNRTFYYQHPLGVRAI
ncbi:MAG: GGDEF domain-containing protein [Gammaproteobacteria bacterium]|nr:GGDEF domain-containing protein [Gammaproteobacteria bacterium]